MNQTTEVSRKSPSEIMHQIRSRADHDPVFKAICERFVERKRTRAQVTIHNLTQVMSKAGYNFSKDQYKDVLKFLASLGVGKLNNSSRGSIRALKDIRWTLQSIGLIGTGKGNGTLEGFNRANTFQSLPIPKHRTQRHTKPLPEIHSKKPVAMEPGGLLTVTIKGKTLNFPIPRDISEEELGYILADLYRGATAPERSGA